MMPRSLPKKLRDALGQQGALPRAHAAAGLLEVRGARAVTVPGGTRSGAALHSTDLEAGATRPAGWRAGPEGHRAEAPLPVLFRLRESGGRSARSTGALAGSGASAAGGPVRHVPVLVRSVVDVLGVRADGVYVDGTFGAGGYSRAILETPGARVVAIDRDRSAVALGADLVAASGGRLTLFEERFSSLDDVAARAGFPSVQGVVLDLGVSSMQLDTAERGFSFRLDGPLDMRMGGDGPSAAEVVAAASERDLAAIISTLGEERFARPIARSIVRARASAPIATTQALADIITRVVHPRPGVIHPATRTFQALRIFVNEELWELAAALSAAERILAPGGRLAVVSFHSLEDRIVKSFLTDRGRTSGVSRHRPDVEQPAPTFRILTKRPLLPSDAESEANPRARSAKLRAAERTDAPARPGDAPALPRLPPLADVLKGR